MKVGRGGKTRGSIPSVNSLTQGTIMAKTAAALHILVKEEKLAQDLLEQLKNGADFGKLAKKHSICPSGKRGGDLGEFRQGQMVPAFDKVVFSCPVLEPTGPLHTQFGYHVIKVLYRK
ncbi:PpiC-type peptidyl-prolyl cis-trans isomerase [Enterobacter cancerogenus]|jgi:peptidyl-prolyl cis-trans isomerase C|uniref:Peptidyl-prolyl cis-trans isomerase C n=2 Tax=Enterobacter cancerogenus TaxID=69218 RepID=A0A484WSA6_9ENTR|nr:Peptidyl-prolyl cis-trans isomerase ppiC [Enterobacter cancerogenus]VFS14224.1 PpiC-type peptidyl-prolyl cis-trans isomerase [Enterobacter cancerogenus]